MGELYSINPCSEKRANVIEENETSCDMKVTENNSTAQSWVYILFSAPPSTNCGNWMERERCNLRVARP